MGRRRSRDDVPEDGLDAPRAQPARRAPTAGFVCAEVEHVVHELGDARARVERDHAAMADARPDRPELLKPERRVEQRRWDHTGERAADDDALRWAGCQAAAELFDDLPDGYAELDFVEARSSEE